MEVEIENVRTAWRFWVKERDLEQLTKLADILLLFYDARGWYHDTVNLTNDLLNVLASTPSTPERIQQEIILQTTLARALSVTKGHTDEAEQAYARALELCERAGEVPQLFPVLRALATLYVFRMENEKALQMGERILQLAEQPRRRRNEVRSAKCSSALCWRLRIPRTAVLILKKLWPRTISNVHARDVRLSALIRQWLASQYPPYFSGCSDILIEPTNALPIRFCSRTG